MPEGRRSCPQCGGTYPSNAEFCALDGTALTDTDTDVLVGRTIGRYKITERVGEGGMARLYRAKHTFLNQDFAIKVLFGELAASTQLVNRFHREAQTVSQIKHPNVVQTVDFGKTEAGLSFMVMEFIEGMPLSRYLRKNNPLPLRVIADIAKQVAAGLSAAHAQGFVHRDLKPGNIMIEEREDGLHAKILDFGLVHLKEPGEDDISKLTKTGQILGTPAYMAPEQISSSEITPRTDLYALGIVMYELILGRAPFSGTMSAVMNKQLFEAAPDITSAGGLETLAKALLEKNPLARPESAQVVVQRIEQLEAAGELDYIPKKREQIGESNSNSTQNERMDRVGTAETQTSLPNIDFGKPRIPAYTLLAGSIIAVLGALYFYMQSSDSEHVEKIAISNTPAPAIIRGGEENKVRKNSAKPKKTAERIKSKKKHHKKAKKRSSESKPNTAEPEPKPKIERENKTAEPKTTEPKTTEPKTTEPESQVEPKPVKPAPTPEKKEPVKETEPETIVEVDVDIEPPSSGAGDDNKKGNSSVGTIAQAHRDDSKKQTQDNQLLKKKLDDLDRNSSGGQAKTAAQRAVVSKEKAIKAIAEKRLVWAEIELGRCLDLDRSNSDCNKLMAVVRERKRDYSGAVKYYKLYLRYTPKAPDRQHVLGVIEKLKNR